jgi:ribosomal protein L11 methyltransferase
LSWLEVSLEVQGELVEPVAELLARHTEGGVALEYHPLDQPTHEAGTIIILRAYIPQDDRAAQRKQAIEEGLWHLGQLSPLPAPHFQDIPEQDWNETWRQRYHPIPIGKTLMVVPAWAENPDEARHKIVLEPGMAFGTGAHPTTRLSLLALEEYCQEGDLIIDLGCGSGILSIGAIRCGAERALAFDIDAQAISSARHNLELNQLSDQIHLEQGSLTAAKQLVPSGGIALLVANILAPILIDMLQEGLSDLVSEDGIVILSGILEEQLDEVLQCATELNLRQEKIYTEADWRAVVFIKKLKAPQ